MIQYFPRFGAAVLTVQDQGEPIEHGSGFSNQICVVFETLDLFCKRFGATPVRLLGVVKPAKSFEDIPGASIGLGGLTLELGAIGVLLRKPIIKQQRLFQDRGAMIRDGILNERPSESVRQVGTDVETHARLEDRDAVERPEIEVFAVGLVGKVLDAGDSFR